MSEPKTVLITAPNYDMMTRYLSTWAHLYAADMEAHNHNVHMIKEEKVDRKTFEGYINKNRPNIILINGHGAKDRIAGHDNQIIADTSNAEIFKDSDVYALSCQSAVALGKAAITAGASGYVGYLMDFILVSQPSKTTHPQDDETAALFLEPSKVIATTLVKGHGAEVAVQKGKAAYTESIRKALNSDVQSDDDKYVPYLVWNRECLTFC